MQTHHRFAAIVLLAGLAAQVCADHYVAQNGQTPDHLGGYTTWSGAASNIQEAVNAASANATVWIGAGRYTAPTNGVLYNGITNIVYLNKPLTLRSADGLPASVILDGQGTNRAVTMYYTSNTADPLVLNGLTISNSWNHGILCDAPLLAAWTSHVQNCVITHGASGGGYYNKGGYNYRVSTVISDTLIRQNPGRGVTVYSSGGTPPPTSRLTDCVIEYNGGGIESHTGDHTYIRCIIRHNDSGTASSGGCGFGAGTYELYNCLIHNNKAGNIGGGVYKWSATGPMRIHNCTIVGNHSTSYGPGGVRSSAINPVCNSIIRFNYFNATISDWYAYGGTTFTNSCSTGVMPGTGNFGDDPAFQDLAGFDFRLSRTSPCVNAGTNLSWMTGASDLDGNPRIDRVTGLVDVGCYEYPFAGTSILIR